MSNIPLKIGSDRLEEVFNVSAFRSKYGFLIVLSGHALGSISVRKKQLQVTDMVICALFISKPNKIT